MRCVGVRASVDGAEAGAEWDGVEDVRVRFGCRVVGIEAGGEESRVAKG